MDFTVSHTKRPYPHDVACADCRAEHRCDVCGADVLFKGCTNGRCMACHAEVCSCTTPNGHGYGTTEAAIRAAAKRAIR